ncbi:MAG: alcohol dehydrogenase catalytic domain-containing protein [Nitrososphaeria archaeon]
MIAAVFQNHGLENLEVKDVPKPEIGSNDVLIKVVLAGVNPIDYFIVKGLRPVKIFPHILGSEFAGIVEDVGMDVRNVKKNDRVIVYPRIFDGECDFCVEGKEMLCRNGGLIGQVSQGGFAEYVSVPSKNVFKINDRVSWEIAASVPIAALTAYHALKEVKFGLNSLVVIVGASGNTGMFAVQFAKMMGAKVVAISRKSWLKDFGADYVTDIEHAHDVIKDLSGGRMADIVVDSLGSETFAKSLELLDLNGKIVTFGTLTGGETKISLSKVYSKHLSIIGATGGTRKEIMEIIEDLSRLKVKIWKKFKLNEVKSSLEALFSPQRDGRIFLEIG